MRQIALYNNATSTSFEGNFTRQEVGGLRNRAGFNENPLIGTQPLSDGNCNISSANGLPNGGMPRPGESVFINSHAHRFITPGSSNRLAFEVQTYQPLTLEEEKVIRNVLKYQSLIHNEEEVLRNVLIYQPLTHSERDVLHKVLASQSLTLEDEKVLCEVLARQPLTLEEEKVLHKVLTRQSLILSDGNVLRKVLAYQPLTLDERDVLREVHTHQPLTLEEEKVTSKVLAYQSLPLRDTPNAPGSSNRQGSDENSNGVQEDQTRRTSHVVLSEPTYDAIRYGLIIVLVICTTCIVIPKCFRRTPALSNSLELPIDRNTPTDAPVGNPPFILAPMIRKKKESADKTTFTADEFKEYLENEPIVNKPDRMILEGIDSAVLTDLEKIMLSASSKENLTEIVANGVQKGLLRTDAMSQKSKQVEIRAWQEEMLLKEHSPVAVARIQNPGVNEDDDSTIRKESKRISNDRGKRNKKKS
jgi:hypothetical protein